MNYRICKAAFFGFLLPLLSLAQTAREKADAIIVLNEGAYTIELPGKGTYKTHTRIRIFNDRGAHYAEHLVGYDELSSVNVFKGKLYDLLGNVLQKDFTKDEVVDISNPATISLYDKQRIRYGKFLRTIPYPFEVEFWTEKEYNGIFNVPDWYFDKEDAYVDSSRFSITYPNDLPFGIRYKARNFSSEPQKVESNGRTTLVWTGGQFPPIEQEPRSASMTNVRSAIEWSPVTFSYGGFDGQMTSWKALGQWLNGLWKGRETVSEAKKQEMLALVADAKTTREKTERIYRYLQNNVRYISVQLGIGGFQPFRATEVEQRNYSDCKGLSNYLRGLLAAVDIPSYPVIIEAGEDPMVMEEDFPRNQFNHVILAVPDGDNFIWLEATSNIAPFDWLSDFTEDRDALMLMPQGGVITHTPKTTAEQNRQINRAQVSWNAVGEATVKLHTVFTGNQSVDHRGHLARQPKVEQEKWLRQYVDIPTVKIVQSDFSNAEKNELETQMDFELGVSRFVTIGGKRVFFKPNMLNRITKQLPKNDQRKSYLYFGYPYWDEDELTFTLPADYLVEALPEAVSLKTPFAEYSTSYRVEGNTLVFNRKMILREKKISATDYEAYRVFLQKVIAGDQAQVVLKSNAP